MKPYKGENSVQKDTHSKPSRTWKKKYPCKKNKGEHTFKLIVPRFISRINFYKGMSVEEYYKHIEDKHKKANEKYKGIKSTYRPLWSSVTYHYECTACGKEEMKSETWGKNRVKIIVD